MGRAGLSFQAKPLGQQARSHPDGLVRTPYEGLLSMESKVGKALFSEPEP